MLSKQVRKVGDIVNRKRISEVKVFTKQRNVKEILESQEMAN